MRTRKICNITYFRHGTLALGYGDSVSPGPLSFCRSLVMNIGQIIVWIIVGGFAGTLAGRAVTLKKKGLGRFTLKRVLPDL
jgi:hypothetical protein